MSPVPPYNPGDGGASSAADVSYDNTGTGLASTNVQDAITELDANGGGGSGNAFQQNAVYDLSVNPVYGVLLQDNNDYDLVSAPYFPNVVVNNTADMVLRVAANAFCPAMSLEMDGFEFSALRRTGITIVENGLDAQNYHQVRKVTPDTGEQIFLSGGNVSSFWDIPAGETITFALVDQVTIAFAAGPGITISPQSAFALLEVHGMYLAP